MLLDSDLDMIQTAFLSPSERRELLSCVKRQREDHGVARRANVVLLLDDGKTRAEVAEFLYLDDDSVYSLVVLTYIRSCCFQL